MGQQKESTQVTYSVKLVDEAAHPRNMRRMSDPDARGIIHGCCGDTMEIYLRLEGDWIKEATFMTDGHESAIACGSTLTAMVRERSVEAAGKISPEELIESLGGLPECKTHCARLTVNTLREALADWRARDTMLHTGGVSTLGTISADSVDPTLPKEIR
ncbi:MAG: iron-sulfur cluster assembly scaffold protein [Thermoflexales bacterium]|nr:iron-sulfur cluster assembly scaffold protein [Thermoflexales bacterium]